MPISLWLWLWLWQKNQVQCPSFRRKVKILFVQAKNKQWQNMCLVSFMYETLPIHGYHNLKKGPFINFGQSYLLLLLPQHLTGDCSVIPLAVVLRFWGGGWFLGNVCKNVLDEDCGTDEEWCNSIPWCCCCWKIIQKIRNLFRKFKTCQKC